ncbi:MAG: glycosyl hydrolase family 31, partial [Bacteroidaceae bacterium]|nr:glycosyl hydrolase family 31 [Bacteroidaceae bacterium]
MAEMPEWIYVTNASLPLKKKVKQTQGGALISLTTSEGNILWVNPDRKEVSVEDKSGKLVFVATQHQLKSSTVAGEATHEATLTMYSPADEYLFGLGQFQDGFVNVRGLSRRLTQVNTQISVPMFLSSKGYGLLWNNYGLVDFNPSDQSVALVKEAGEGVQEVVNVTSTTGGRQEVRVRNLFKGQFSVPTKGKYSLLLDVGQTMARRHNLSIDGKLLVDHRNLWLPPTTSILCDLEAGTHTIEAELERGDKPVVYYQPVKDQTVLRSPVAEAVDYTVFVGSPDEVIAAYRQTTGPAPMMPKWALGYIHCRERFHSSDEIVNTARRFRDNNIPLDLIVQDWQWWGKYGWNAMQ